MTVLKGLAWNNMWHADTLAALTQLYHHQYGVAIEWDYVDLTKYLEGVFGQVIDEYDLVLMKNRHGALLSERLGALEGYLDPRVLDEAANGIIGKGYESFGQEGRHYGMPFVVTASVGAYRRDLMGELGLQVPESWAEVLAMGRKLPKGVRIGQAMDSRRLLDLFDTIHKTKLKALEENDHEEASGHIEYALSVLESLMALAGEEALEMTLGDVLSIMSSGERIIYTPMTIANANYSKDGYRKHIIDYVIGPGVGDRDCYSLFYASGLGLVEASKNKTEAAAFIEMVCSKEVQRHMIVDLDGHPLTRCYWKDKRNNQKTNGFFKSIMPSVERAEPYDRVGPFTSDREFVGKLIWDYLKYRRVDRNTFARDLSKILGELVPEPMTTK